MKSSPIGAYQHGSCIVLALWISFGEQEVIETQFQVGDDVVFMDAGVMHLFSEQVRSKVPGFYFSSEDLDARGLLRIGRDLALDILDDRASANLLRNHDHCLTWK